MKLQLTAVGVLCTLLGACADRPYHDDRPPYYASSAYRAAYDNDWTVVNIEVGLNEVETHRRVADVYRITVRGPNGNYETYVMESLGMLRVGDHVRVGNGTLYPIG